VNVCDGDIGRPISQDGDAADRGSQPEVRRYDEQTPNMLSVQMKKTLHMRSYLPKFFQSQIWLICKKMVICQNQS